MPPTAAVAAALPRAFLSPPPGRTCCSSSFALSLPPPSLPRFRIATCPIPLKTLDLPAFSDSTLSLLLLSSLIFIPSDKENRLNYFGVSTTR